MDDQTLTPPFAPPLQGQLTITYFTRAGVRKDMIDLFGGIRFRHMDLSNVDGTRLLLGACGKTPETLRLYPTDTHGKEPFPNRVRVLADNFTARSTLWDFDLSRNKSLRALRVTTASIDGEFLFHSQAVPTNLLTYALSTITSPVFSEVTVFYRDYDFRGVARNRSAPSKPFICQMLPDEMAEDALWHCRGFDVFREMHKVRDFRLMLCPDVWDGIGWYSVRVLKDAVAEERAKGGFNNLSSEPTVVYSPRASHSEFSEGHLAPSLHYWAPL